MFVFGFGFTAAYLGTPFSISIDPICHFDFSFELTLSCFVIQFRALSR
jgi:hypothetical protein